MLIELCCCSRILQFLFGFWLEHCGLQYGNFLKTFICVAGSMIEMKQKFYFFFGDMKQCTKVIVHCSSTAPERIFRKPTVFHEIFINFSFFCCHIALICAKSDCRFFSIFYSKFFSLFPFKYSQQTSVFFFLRLIFEGQEPKTRESRKEGNDANLRKG